MPLASIVGDKNYAGLVRSKAAANHITYDQGYGEVHSLSTDKLVNGTEEFVLNGGNASGKAN